MDLFGLVLCLLSLHGGYHAMVVLANILHISRTLQLNSTAVTTFELYIDEEVGNDNKLYKWYERSMGRMVHGTNIQRYETSRHPPIDRLGEYVASHCLTVAGVVRACRTDADT